MSQTKLTLKTYFQNGDIPDADNFAELIDSAYNQLDDLHRLGAKTYDPVRTYAADDTCLYDDGGGIKLYRANAGTTGSFDSDDWDSISGSSSGAFSNEYAAVAHVDFTNGDDLTAVLNTPSKPFQNINTATSAVKAEVISLGSGGRGYVIVRPGVYYENRINREFVDMYFEFGSIVISTTEGLPVITDTDGNNEPLNIKIKGQGQFYHKYYNTDMDSQAVATNNANTKSFELEAYELDGIQNYGYDAQEFIYRNIRIRFALDFWSDKNLSFHNCIFRSGLSLGHYIATRTSVYCNECEFILPVDGFESHLDIKDPGGSTIETIEIETPSYTPINTTSLSRTDVKNTHHSSLSEPLLSGIYVNGSFDNDFYDDFRVEVTNSIVRIRKEKCIGINITQKHSHNLASDKRAYWIFRNIHIEDETAGKDTTAIVAKKLNTATDTIPFAFSAITTNCAVTEDKSPYETDYLAIESQFDFLPDTKSKKTGGQTGTTYTLQAKDNGGFIYFSNSSSVTVTVPASLGLGFNCIIFQEGTGTVTISGSGGTTIVGKTATTAQYDHISITNYKNTNVYAGL